MAIDDVTVLVRWDDDPDVAAAIGGRGADWYDWPAELVRDVPWRELLIIEENGRPIGFLQLIDASEEESHYWGDIEPGTWALDIWIGSPDDRGRGLGAEAVKQALGRVFDQHGAETVVIDPAVENRRADRQIRGGTWMRIRSSASTTSPSNSMRASSAKT
jgi:aminoglycoside 6'-N-acetyltransferase